MRTAEESRNQSSQAKQTKLDKKLQKSNEKSNKRQKKVETTFLSKV